MAYGGGYGTQRYISRNAADTGNQQALGDLSGSMLRTGATIGNTGGLNYSGQNPVPGQAYAQNAAAPQVVADGGAFLRNNPNTTATSGLVPGPNSQQVSGNAVPNPNPNATLQPTPPPPLVPANYSAPTRNTSPQGSMPTVPGFDPNASYETNLAQYNKNFATSDNPAWLAALAPQQQAWEAAHPGQGNNPTGPQYGLRSGTLAAPAAPAAPAAARGHFPGVGGGANTAAAPPPAAGGPLYQNVGGFMQPTAAGYANDAAQQAAEFPNRQLYSTDPTRAALQQALYASYARQTGFG